MDDRDISELLHDAVADVEPADRLAEIREHTSPAPSRSGWYAAGGGVLAIAAALTAFAVIGDPAQRADDDLGGGPTPTPSETTHAPLTDDPGGPATPVYYLGETSRGTRLFREFARFGPGDPGQRALAGLQSTPDDPDYRTLWVDTLLGDAVSDPEAGVVVVFVDPDARARPTGMTPLEAELSIQQVVYTLQAVFEDPTLAVQFRTESNPIDQVFGVPTSEPLGAAPQLDVLSWMSISDPGEGRVVSGTFTAQGRASSFEGNVPWRLLAEDRSVVREGFATAGMEDYLVEWETEAIDVSDLARGTYTFEASTEGSRPFTDTRTVVVQ
jgi:Immunoglobulin-like domain of bacterial spore germination